MGTVLLFDQSEKKTYKHLYRRFCRNRVTALPSLEERSKPTTTAADCTQCIHRVARKDNRNIFSISDICREFPLPKEVDPDDGKLKPVRHYFSGSRRFLMSLEEPYGYCGDKIKGGRCRDFKRMQRRARQ